MLRKLRYRVLIFLLCGTFLSLSVPAEGQYNIGPTKGQFIGVVVGIVAVGAAIGIGVFYLARRSHSVTGCVSSGANGLQLQSEADHQTYLLMGDVADAKPGDRVRVKGRKKKAKAPATEQSVLVEKFAKDFGPCRAQPSTP